LARQEGDLLAKCAAFDLAVIAALLGFRQGDANPTDFRLKRVRASSSRLRFLLGTRLAPIANR
jgi:hypothetical protein